MRVCGIEIKGNEAIFAVTEWREGKFNHIPTATKRITLADDDESVNVRSFSDLIAGFLRDNMISHVAIKKRSKKGDFAGGPITFKIEGIFQLLKETKVEIIPSPTIAAQARKHNFPTPDSLNKYQVEAFRSACSAIAKLAATA